MLDSNTPWVFRGKLLITPLMPTGIPVTKDGRMQWVMVDEFGFGPVTVEKDFIIDFASVPRMVWSIFPPDGKYMPASVIHDYLCALKGRLPTGQFFTSDETHRIFLKAMEALQVRKRTRKLVYRAVKEFGPQWA